MPATAANTALLKLPEADGDELTEGVAGRLGVGESRGLLGTDGEALSEKVEGWTEGMVE
jgi:hypothetical protein